MRFTGEQLTAMRGGLTAEEYRWKLFDKNCAASLEAANAPSRRRAPNF